MDADLTPHIRALFQSELLRVFDYRCVGHDNKDEIPEDFEIVLPRAGAYQRWDAHGAFLADSNQVVFYNQGEPYDISHPIKGADTSTVFAIAPAVLIETIRAYDPDVENNPQKLFWRSHIALATRLQILQYKFLRTDMAYEPLEMEEQVIVAVGEIIHALYQERARKQRQTSSKTPGDHYEQTQAVKVFLNAHIRSRLQLEQISSAVHLSPFHLCRIFKQSAGMTLHQYIKRLRLFNAAEHMLENPNARLDLLALDYGFSNHGHFTTTFRQTFGVNPSDLRGARLRQMSKILKA